MRDSLSLLATAAQAVDALDILAEAATNVDVQAEAALLQAVQDMPLLAPPPPPLPLPSCLALPSPMPPFTYNENGIPPQPLLRQIREDIWEGGEYYLQDNPNADEIMVHFHHWDERMRWEFKVVRVGNGLQRQTWLNGVLMG
jgi:hypothetical protein